MRAFLTVLSVVAVIACNKAPAPQAAPAPAPVPAAAPVADPAAKPGGTEGATAATTAPGEAPTGCSADCTCAGCAAKRAAAAAAGKPAGIEGATTIAAPSDAPTGCGAACTCPTCAAKRAAGTDPKAACAGMGAATADPNAAAADGEPTPGPGCGGADGKPGCGGVAGGPGCGGAASTESATAPAGAAQFGEVFAIAEPPVALDDIIAKADEFNGKTIKVAATITKVCKKKGCWFVLEGEKGDGSYVRVTMKGYGFFVPLDCDGKKAVVEGVFKKVDVPEAARKHLAEDGKEDPNKIQGAAVELTLVANGVAIDG